MAEAQTLSLPGVFGDHMVFQRDRPVRFWGRAGAGERVAVEAVETVTVRAGKRTQYTDVMSGDVWPASVSRTWSGQLVVGSTADRPGSTTATTPQYGTQRR